MEPHNLTESALRQHQILFPTLPIAKHKTSLQTTEDHDSTKSPSRLTSRSELRKSFPLGIHDTALQLPRQLSRSSIGTSIPRNGLSFFRVVQAAKTWKRLSQRKEGVVEQPKGMFENTYRLGPNEDQTFKRDKVVKAIEETLNLFLKNFKYTTESSKRMCLTISTEIKSRVKGMNFYRYKTVTQVVILQNKQQGLNIASRCIWSPETDSFASCTFQSQHIICVATVYAIYLE